MSQAQVLVKAVGPGSAAVQLDLQALVEGALVQLYGVVGAPAFQADQQSGVITVDKRDESKLRAALALVSSSNDGKPLRLDLE